MGTPGTNGVVSNTYYLVNSDGTLEADGAGENNYNIYYEESTHMLTLNNLQIKVENKWLLVPGGTTINVLGENRIEPPDEGTYGGGIAVVQDGDITITGSGSLYVKSNSRAGICSGSVANAYSGRSTTGGVTINGSVELTIDHTGAASCISANKGDIVFGGSAKVHLDPRAGNDKDNNAITRFDGGNIIVQGSAEVTSTGGIDTTGTNSSGEYGKITISGGTLTITDASTGTSLRGYGGIEIGKGTKVKITNHTKSGQAIVASRGTIKVDGEVEVTMTNEAPAGSAALYAQAMEITGKVIVNGGTNAFYINGGKAVTLNGAEVNVSNCTIGFQAMVEITNSLMEISTKSRAFNTTVTASLTDDYEVRSGLSAENAELFPVENGSVSSSAWFKAYTRISYMSKISANPTSLAFDAQTSGYTSLPEAKTVTITNTGLGSIANLSVALRDGDENTFTLDTDSTAAFLDAGDSTSFTIQPKSGLSAGKHEAVVLVSYGGAEPVQIPVSMDVIPAKPEAIFTATGDNSGILSNVTTAMQYSVDGGVTWNAITGTTMDIAGVSADNDIKVYQPGNHTVGSEIQTIDVTQASEPDGLAGVACTTSEQNDGQITGVDTSMEYKLSSTSVWLPVTSQTLKGLADGTYDVRVKASGKTLASPAKPVTIGAHICVATGDWHSDGINHWKLCVCTAKVDEDSHTGGEATCQNGKICVVCDVEYTSQRHE